MNNANELGLGTHNISPCQARAIKCDLSRAMKYQYTSKLLTSSLMYSTRWTVRYRPELPHKMKYRLNTEGFLEMWGGITFPGN